MFCALGGAQGIKTPKTLVPSFFWFQKRKIATKGVFRARICVSTPELAMVFRGESVSGHPGARGGQKNPENHPEKFQKIQEIPSKKTLVPKPWVPSLVSKNVLPPGRISQNHASVGRGHTGAEQMGA